MSDDERKLLEMVQRLCLLVDNYSIAHASPFDPDEEYNQMCEYADKCTAWVEANYE